MIEVLLTLNETKLCAVQNDVPVECWNVARGKLSTPTPAGTFFVSAIIKHTKYVSPWLLPFHTDGNTTLAIHSWNGVVSPSYVSSGCIRLNPEDLNDLINNYLFNTLIVTSE